MSNRNINKFNLEDVVNALFKLDIIHGEDYLDKYNELYDKYNELKGDQKYHHKTIRERKVSDQVAIDFMHLLLTNANQKESKKYSYALKLTLEIVKNQLNNYYKNNNIFNNAVRIIYSEGWESENLIQDDLVKPIWSAIIDFMDENRLVKSKREYYDDIVDSYQGSFSPPHIKHAGCMFLNAIQHLIDYDSSDHILMLFMPGKSSSSKKHLEPTYNQRVEMLNIYCEMLDTAFNTENKFLCLRNFNNLIDELDIMNAIEQFLPLFDDEYDDFFQFIYTNRGKLIFETSKIEFFTPKSETIFTIDALIEKYPNTKINLTMGIDNAFDLPFWAKVKEYNDKINKVYTPYREISDAEKKKLYITNISYENINSGIPENNGFKRVAFFKKPSWSKPDIPENITEKLNDLTENTSSIVYRINLLPPPGSASSTDLRKAMKDNDLETIESLLGKTLFQHQKLWQQYVRNAQL